MNTYGNRRPRYETRTDRNSESRVRKMLCNLYPTSEITEHPKYHSFDSTIICKDREGWLEIKIRPDIGKNKYPTYMISETKWETGKAAVESKIITTFMIVVFYPTYHQLLVYTYKLEDEKIDEHGECRIYRAMGGRNDRNDKADQEPCIFIPIWMFEMFDTRSLT